MPEINVARAFKLNLGGDDGIIDVPAGVQEVGENIAGHFYTQQHLVRDDEPETVEVQVEFDPLDLDHVDGPGGSLPDGYRFAIVDDEGQVVAETAAELREKLEADAKAKAEADEAAAKAKADKEAADAKAAEKAAADPAAKDKLEADAKAKAETKPASKGL